MFIYIRILDDWSMNIIIPPRTAWVTSLLGGSLKNCHPLSLFALSSAKVIPSAKVVSPPGLGYNLMKKSLSVFLKSIAPVDRRSSAAGTAAASSALSGSVTATQTVRTTLTNCLWTSNVWPQVRLLLGSQLEALHQCQRRHRLPGILPATYGRNKRRRDQESFFLHRN